MAGLPRVRGLSESAGQAEAFPRHQGQPGPRLNTVARYDAAGPIQAAITSDLQRHARIHSQDLTSGDPGTASSPLAGDGERNLGSVDVVCAGPLGVRSLPQVRRLPFMVRGSTVAAVPAAGIAAGLGYYLVVTGKLTMDTGWGRRLRPLGPFGVTIAAPAAAVFDIIATPYLGKTPRAMAGHLRVLQRGKDMVLAEHYTPVHGGRLTAVTLEAVSFDRPRRVAFHLVRGPVPHVVEEFTLTEHDGATRLEYSGELGTDFGWAGQWWGERVAAAWEQAVRASFASIQAEAERRARPSAATP
jgi:hypothetical protein